MADLMKNIRKKTVRAKESLLVSLGKSDRTTDEQFEEHCVDFTKQQKNAEKLQKELKNYVSCLKALNQASKGFYEAIRETYEPQWDDVEHVKAMTHSLELLWEDYLERMNDQALSPLNSYCGQFQEVKTKIDKRRRKLLDYDSARHNYDSAQQSSKKDDKLQKAQDQLNDAKKFYEDLNRELMTELPELYEARVGFTLNHFQTIFGAEQTFHSETGKLSGELFEKIGKIKSSSSPNYHQRNPPIVRPPQPSVKPIHSTVPNSNSNHDSSLSNEKRSSAVSQHQQQQPVIAEQPTELVKPKVEEKAALYPTISNNTAPSDKTDNNPFGDDEDDEIVKKPAPAVVENGGRKRKEEKVLPKEAELPPAPFESPKETPAVKAETTAPVAVVEKTVVEAVVETPKLNVLYKVRATHRYQAEDTDELSFDAGDVIDVVPCEDPDEQDDGWLTGIKQSTGEKGVFPANFTKNM